MGGLESKIKDVLICSATKKAVHQADDDSEHLVYKNNSYGVLPGCC